MSAKVLQEIAEALKDPAFRADWEALDQDGAFYLIYEQPQETDSRTWSIHDGGGVLFNPIQQIARTRNVRQTVTGLVSIGTAPGADPARCTVPHEVIHVKGLVGGGTSKNGDNHPDFNRPYFIQNGCRPAHR